MQTPRSARWTTRLPDLTGSRAVVTGASDGVGVEIARGLARAGAEIVLPVRSRSKGERAIARIRETAPRASLVLIDLDLADFASVESAASSLLRDGRPIDRLVLNAGMVALGDPLRRTSRDGHELHLQTNHLGHFVFVARILPLLRAGAARVTAQSSMAVKYRGVEWDDPEIKRGYSALKAYGSSKAALSLFVVELGRRSAVKGSPITANLSHPGIALTNIAPAELLQSRSAGARSARWAMDHGVGGTPAEASLPALLAVAGTEALPGALYGPGGFLHLQGPPRRERLFRPLADQAAAQRAWALSEQLSGVRIEG